ncbi:uncharacterized protein STEHIDRAFT_61594 [Stereum hirsutum FP-91666 SS1]|uniref:uncharacterized protein n=1 Tax=Stereum hirsutum (strain FP-91666) TaxID=721885 RepID=UPI000444A6FA|nr:uncharacterized protein STEHIDRAFT_61594 [Stereum hirsutum FP-91666 SS1]EIM84396.1 hypothetical protein STEHIDRAFT_61594 [Stereum hirsutum FP-91666 SS1]
MSPDSIGIPTSIQMWIGMISVWIGGAIRMACYRELGRLFTYELTIREKHRLVTSGPYSIVRHPSYTGCAILAIGMSIYHLSPGTYWTDSSLMQQTYFGKLVALLWTVILVYSALVFMRAEKEDKMLKEEFGKEWEEWAERTKWRFIPWVA